MTEEITGGKNKYAIKHIFNIVTHGNYKSF